MKKLLLAIGMALSIAVQTSAAPDTPRPTTESVWERGCGDDDGNDRCAATTQQAMREIYRIEDPTALMQKGVVLRRAMMIDGYGNDLLAVSFLRRPGLGPQVEVRIPCRPQGECVSLMLATVSQKTWERALTLSDNFDQKLAKEVAALPDGQEQPLAICLHGWVVVVEAVDPARAAQNMMPAELRPGLVRTDTESACAGGLAIPYAFELVELASLSLPECGTLQPEWFRNTATLLAACTALKGDRLAAGEAYGIVRNLTCCSRPDPDRVKKLFGFDGEERAQQFLGQAGNGHIFFESVTATDQDNAMFRGKLYFRESGGKPAEESTLELKLIRRLGEFLIGSFEIGPRKATRS